MKLHTVFITYNRLELTKQAIESYLETVSVPYQVVVVDNGSEDGTVEWLQDAFLDGVWLHEVLDLQRNFYPGYATNRGWGLMWEGATHLHRADNDFAFLPGWCEEVERIFGSEKVGQVGLRTDEQEPNGRYNVGGNNIIRRELWDKGLRYDERPWPEMPPGYSEDSFFSPAVEALGYTWTRVKKTCIIPLSFEDPGNNFDPYYEHSWGKRRIYGRTVDS